MASLRELRLMVTLANRQAKIERGLVGLSVEDRGETLKPHDEKYLLEEEDAIKEDIDADIIADEIMTPQVSARIEAEVNAEFPQLIRSIVKPKIDDFIKANPLEIEGRREYYPVDVYPFMLKTKDFQLKKENLPDVYLNSRVEAQKIADENLRLIERINRFNATMKEKIEAKEQELIAEIKAKAFEDKSRVYVNQIINDRKSYNLKAMSAEKLPAESDADYARRLEQINENMPQQSTLIQQQKDKKRRELIRHFETLMKPSDAYAVANGALFVGETGENNVILLNRTWKKFDKQLRETYDKLDVPTFNTFVQIYLHKLALNPEAQVFEDTPVEKKITIGSAPVVAQAPASAVNINEPFEEEEPVEAEAVPMTGADIRTMAKEEERQQLADLREVMNSALINGDKLAYRDILEALQEKYGEQRFPDSIIYIPDEGEEGGYKTYKREVEQGLNIGDRKIRSPSEIHAKLATRLTALVKEGKYEVGSLGIQGFGKPKRVVKAPAPRQRKKVVKKVIYGGGAVARSKGIAIEKTYPVYIPFGKSLIEEAPLVKDNYLTVRSSISGVIQDKIKEMRVSDDFKDIILDIQEKEKFDDRLFRRLSADEKNLMSHIIKKAGLKNALYIPEGVFRNKQENDVLDRWEIVRKKLAEGVEDPFLIREAKGLVELLIQYKRIPRATGYKLLYDLVNTTN